MIFLLTFCSKKQDPVVAPANQEAVLLQLDFAVNESVFNTLINKDTITLSRDFPNGTLNAVIKYIYTDLNCTSSLAVGDLLDIKGSNSSITITNTLSKKTRTYQIKLGTKTYTSIVAKNGLLHTSGNKILNKFNQPISLAGNSFFWSNKGWGGENYYKPQIVNWLALDWETTIVRAAMGVDADGGYLQDKTGNINKVRTIVDAAIAKGIYVIIDWHTENAYMYTNDAIDFFTQMATIYGKNDNIIYEVFNEPLDISWSGVIKPYAEQVIAAIRKVDPDHLIIVGTPTWSQRVDLAAADPIISATNIAYTLHFYTTYHKQALRDIANSALKSGIPLFVTEWGPLGYTLNDPEADLWMQWCKDNMISHCAWSVNDKLEAWSIVNAGAYNLNFWTDQNLTASGLLERKIIRSWPK
jgi:endoglucanase